MSGNIRVKILGRDTIPTSPRPWTTYPVAIIEQQQEVKGYTAIPLTDQSSTLLERNGRRASKYAWIELACEVVAELYGFCLEASAQEWPEKESD